MKKIGLLFFLVVFFVSIIVFKVSSQESPAQPSQSWKCLRGEPQGFTFTGAGNTTLTQDLYADGYPLNIDVYVV